MIPYIRSLRFRTQNATVLFRTAVKTPSVIDFALFGNDSSASSVTYEFRVTGTGLLFFQVPAGYNPPAPLTKDSATDDIMTPSDGTFSVMMRFCFASTTNNDVVEIGLYGTNAFVHSVRVGNGTVQGRNSGTLTSSQSFSFSDTLVQEFELRVRKGNTSLGTTDYFGIVLNNYTVSNNLLQLQSSTLLISQTTVNTAPSSLKLAVQGASNPAIWIDYVRLVAGDELW